MTSLLNNTGKMSRLLSLLHPHIQKSNISQKHAAMVISGGKPMTIGFNHDRTTSSKKVMLSYHAEMHALAQFIHLNNLDYLMNFMNDTERCLSFKRGLKKYP